MVIIAQDCLFTSHFILYRYVVDTTHIAKNILRLSVVSSFNEKSKMAAVSMATILICYHGNFTNGILVYLIKFGVDMSRI